jgi:hypothetical protein
MKNNTKIRLHISKQLFESLAKQVLAEAKVNMSGGAYTEVVKAPKVKKEEALNKEKAPEMKAPIKKKAMGEMETRVAEEKEGLSKIMSDLKGLSKADKHKLHAALSKHLKESPVEEVKVETEE